MVDKNKLVGGLACDRLEITTHCNSDRLEKIDC